MQIVTAGSIGYVVTPLRLQSTLVFRAWLRLKKRVSLWIVFWIAAIVAGTTAIIYGLAAQRTPVVMVTIERRGDNVALAPLHGGRQSVRPELTTWRKGFGGDRAPAVGRSARRRGPFRPARETRQRFAENPLPVSIVSKCPGDTLCPIRGGETTCRWWGREVARRSSR